MRAMAEFKSRLALLHRMIAGTLILWTLLAALSLTWSIINQREQTYKLAMMEARANFNKDKAFRFWAAKHGGVYVPPDERTPPNPHLSHIPDRDVITNTGKSLTLMNPAYMLHQMMEEFSELYGIKGRITSFKYLNPMNKPDEWEQEALKAFEEGREEVSGITMLNGNPYLRLMRPMLTEEPCLKCHISQGYKVGDIRGGVGVSVPMAPYLQIEERTVKTMILSHVIFWLLGCTGIGYGYYRGKRRIIDQTRANEALWESEEKFSSITSVLGEGVYMLDKEGCVTFMNPEAERLLGWKESELSGKNMHNIIHYQRADGSIVPPMDCPLETVVLAGNTYRTESDIFTKKDGTMLPVSYVSTPINKNGEVIATVTAFQDITERMRIREMEMERHKEQLLFEQRRHEAIRELLVNIAHQWRQPLNAIGVIVQDIKDSYRFNECSNDYLDKSVSTVMEELNKLSATINRFEGVYHYRKEREEFSLSESIRNSLSIIDTSIKSNNILVETQLQEDVNVIGYPQDFSQAVINILTNSVEILMERTGIKKIIRISLAKPYPGHKAEIIISDNGGGVSEEIMDKIFDPYFTTKFKSTGTGLGLYMAKIIIEKEMAGKLTVRNVEGSAQFTIEL